MKKDKLILFSLLLSILIGISTIDIKYIVFLFIAILVLIFSKKNKYVLFIAVLLNESFFYLFDFTDLPLINIRLIFLMVFSFLFINNQVVYKFKNNILLILSLCIVSSFTSYVTNGQPILTGLQATKIMYSYLFYFYITSIFKSHEDIKMLEKTIIYGGLLLSIIFSIQYLLYDKIVFLHVNFLDSRFGNVRFYTGFSLIIFSLFLSFGKLFYYNKAKIKMLIIVIYELLSIVLITQTRNYIIALFGAILFMIIIQKRYNKLLILSVLGIFVASLIFFLDLNSIFDLIRSAYNELINNNGTVGVRLNAINYFLKQIDEHKVFGLGFYSLQYYPSYYILGLHNSFYLSDVGIIGYIFETGLLGLSILLLLIIKMFRYLSITSKLNGDILGELGFFVYTLFSIFSTFYYGLNETVLYIVILLAIIELKYKLTSNSQIIKEKNNETKLC